jgi:hypothetical protein
MSVVPFFLVRCDAKDIKFITDTASEVWQLKFEHVHNEDLKGETWFIGDMGIDCYRRASESELAKCLFNMSCVIELRVGYEQDIERSTQVTADHHLINNNGLEYLPRSWLLDESGDQLLDDDGKPLPSLDYAHKRMALLAQAFNATDEWLDDEQWKTIADKWIPKACLGGMK